MEICSLVKQVKVSACTKHSLYCTWRMMNYRCYSDVHGSFPSYGGAGIYVSPEWRWDNPEGFYNFLQDFFPRPEKHTLDRVDPYGIYSKDNCRWADKRTQQNNFRREKTTESGYLGVVKYSSTKWRPFVQLNGKTLSINFYADLQEAIAAREAVMLIKMEQGDDAALAHIKANVVVTPEGKRFYGRKTSKYYGVSWDKRQCNWRSVLARRVDGKLKQVFLGTFHNEDLAAQAVLDFLEKEKNESCV